MWAVPLCPGMPDRPTRGADRNRDLATRADPETGDCLFPSLDTGITLLDVDGGRGVPLVQSLVLDHLLLHDGPAFWVDANGHATTTTLARIAPSRRLLDRIHVARGFTASQHYGAVGDLVDAVDGTVVGSTAEGPTGGGTSRDRDGESSASPSLVVAPAVDARYREADGLADAHAATLQARTLARLGHVVDRYEVPVLLTRSDRDAFSEPIAAASDHHLECKQTGLGPRFVGEDFETLVYPDRGEFYQTTFAYWRRVVAARATQVGLEPSASCASSGGVEGNGAGVTTGDETASLAADPLLDAWRNTASTRGR
jgi:hypothetical protein